MLGASRPLQRRCRALAALSPPEAGSGKEGVAGILDQPTDTLRHFALDMEFSVEGTATLFFHVSPVPNAPNKQQSYFFVLSSKDGGLKAGEKYTMVVSYVGSSIAVEFPGNDGDLKSTNDAVVWTTRRKGGFAFQIPEGTRLKVTRMRIKDLR